MVDPSRDPYSKPHARPRWVKALGIVALVVVALVIIILLAGGEHGPGRHTPGNNSGIGSDRESTISATAGTANRHAPVGYVIG